MAECFTFTCEVAVPEGRIDDGLGIGGRPHLARADVVPVEIRELADVTFPVFVRELFQMSAARQRIAVEFGSKVLERRLRAQLQRQADG